MTSAATYRASPIKRKRATKAEMEERAEFLIAYRRGARAGHGSAALLSGRGRRPSRHRQDRQRLRQGPGASPKAPPCRPSRLRTTLRTRRDGCASLDRWDGIEQALADTARSLPQGTLVGCRRDYVEIWCEKDALAGVVLPVSR